MKKPTQDEIIDIKGALARAGDDFDSLVMMAEVYFDYSKKQLANIKNALKYENMQEVHDISHALKGSLGMLGSISAYQSMKKLEEAAKEYDIDNAKILYKKMYKDIQLFEQALKNIIKNKLY